MARIKSTDRATLDWTDKLYGEAKSWKDELKLPAKWREYRRIRNGQGNWPLSRPPAIEADLIGNYLDRKISAITESRPETFVTSRRKDYGAPAKILGDTQAALWQHLRVMAKNATAAETCGVTGCVGYLTEWNPAALDGRGDIEIRVLPPESIFLSPDITATEDLQEGSCVGWEEYVALDDLIDRFPGRGGLVEPDEGQSFYQTLQTPSPGRRIRSPALPSGGLAPRKVGVIPMARVKTFYVKDWSRDSTGTRLYPHRRRIIRGGNIILSDGPSPYWDGQVPLDLWNWYKRSGSPWGEGDIARLRKLAEAFNRLGDLMMRNAIANNNIWIVGDNDALGPKEWEKLDNLEALVVKKRFGRELRRDPPPNMPPYYFQLLSFIPQIMETLIGLMDVAPGARRTASQSLGALEGYQQSSLAIVRNTARNLEDTIRGVGQKLLSRIVQYYTSNRVFGIVGPSQEFQQYVFERAKLLKDDRGKQIMATNQEEGRQFLSEFSYEIVPNSGLVMSRIQRSLIMKELKQGGLVTGLAVLKSLGPELIPDADNEYERAQQEMKAMAEMGILPNQRRTKSNAKGTQMGLGN